MYLYCKFLDTEPNVIWVNRGGRAIGGLGDVDRHGLGECTCSGVYLLGGCTCSGGVPAWGCTFWGGCTCSGGVPAEGVYLPRGCTCWGCVPARGFTCLGVYPSMHWDRHTPVNRMTDRCLWKYYLTATSLRTAIIGFHPKFVLEVLDPTLPVPVRKRLRRRVHPGQLYFMFGDRVFRPVDQFLSDKKPSGGSKEGREGCPPGGPNSFNFMPFLGKFGKIVCWRPLESWRPLLGEILDTPLQCQ